MSTATTDLLAGQSMSATQARGACEETPSSPAVIGDSSSTGTLPQGAPTSVDHLKRDTHAGSVGGPSFLAGHCSSGAHTAPAREDSTTGHDQACHDAQTKSVESGATSPTGQREYDAQRTPAGGGGHHSDPSATVAPIPKYETLADPTLALAADVLDDLETVRIANQNRLRTLTRDEADSDGEQRGFGLDESHPDVARLAALVKVLEEAEHHAVLNLQRVMRKHPLGPWIKTQKGVGDKQAARLLAVIGDPYVNMQTGEVRTVSQLWAYAGHGDPARRKFKGMSQSDLFRLGNPTAKKRTWSIAASILKAGGGEERAIVHSTATAHTPSLAVVYYQRKHATEGREHTAECVRCGPSGHPALPGSLWSDAHRHADALRVLGKAFLRELWIESRRLHEEQS